MQFYFQENPMQFYYQENSFHGLDRASYIRKPDVWKDKLQTSKPNSGHKGKKKENVFLI